MTSTTTQFEAVAYCVEPNCKCEDRSGVLISSGPIEAEVRAAALRSIYANRDGYQVDVRPSS